MTRGKLTVIPILNYDFHWSSFLNFVDNVVFTFCSLRSVSSSTYWKYDELFQRLWWSLTPISPPNRPQTSCLELLFCFCRISAVCLWVLNRSTTSIMSRTWGASCGQTWKGVSPAISRNTYFLTPAMSRNNYFLTPAMSQNVYKLTPAALLILANASSTSSTSSHSLITSP